MNIKTLYISFVGTLTTLWSPILTSTIPWACCQPQLKLANIGSPTTRYVIHLSRDWWWWLGIFQKKYAVPSFPRPKGSFHCTSHLRIPWQKQIICLSLYFENSPKNHLLNTPFAHKSNNASYTFYVVFELGFWGIQTFLLGNLQLQQQWKNDHRQRG